MSTEAETGPVANSEEPTGEPELTYEDIVVADVKGSSDNEQRDMLHQDIDRWIAVLEDLLEDVDIQFIAREAQVTEAELESLRTKDKEVLLEKKAAYQHWVVGAKRFHASINSKLRYVKSLKSKSM
jgi:hypothetical protein